MLQECWAISSALILLSCTAIRSAGFTALSHVALGSARFWAGGLEREPLLYKGRCLVRLPLPLVNVEKNKNIYRPEQPLRFPEIFSPIWTRPKASFLLYLIKEMETL